MAMPVRRFKEAGRRHAAKCSVMSDEESFMRAIIDNPADDHLRLVYADWLEERGDPRGEFIRIQMELEQPSLDERGRLSLVIREKELLALHGKSWSGPLEGLASSYSFRKGFVDSAALTAAAFVSAGETLLRQTVVRRLWLREIGDAAYYFQSELFGNLIGLTLDGNRLGSYELELILDDMPASLQELSVNDCGLALEGARIVAFAGLRRNLQRLAMSYNPIGDLGLQAFCGSTDQYPLRALEVAGCDIGDTGFRALASSKLLAGLHRLDISANTPGSRALRNLVSSRRASELRELNLSQTGMDTMGVRALVECTHFAHLETLNLANNQISPGGARLLAESPNLKGLKSLNLSGNPIGPDDKPALRQRFAYPVAL